MPNATEKPALPLKPIGKSDRHVPALDGIRGLAIILVLLHHIAPPGDEQLRWHGVSHARFVCDLFCRVSRSGWTGVDLFFVLSGFLITGILADTGRGRRYFRNFYIRRALRVLPLYYGVLLVVLVILPRIFPVTAPDARYVIAHPLPLWTHAANLAMAIRGQWYLGGGLLDLTHFWSLAIEEQFYLVWPAVVLLLPRKKAMGICVGLFLLSPATRLWLALRGAPDVTIYCFTFARLDSLAAGAFLALWMRGPSTLQTLVRPARFMLAGCIAGLFALAAASGNWTLDHQGVGPQTFTFTFVALFFAAMLILVVQAPHTAAASRFFAHPAMRFFGRYSYGIYVFNSLINAPFVAWLPPRRIALLTHSLELGAVIHVILEIALTIGVSMLSYHLYEKHFLRLKDLLAPAEKSPTPPAPAIGYPAPATPAYNRAA
ncbi:MAG TPA: acyltransferase [Tepidisphaeraceae bacterium]|nr:acyltransferase [Tepidisphaeraceae bacterium]